jgi:hypothetical protein
LRRLLALPYLGCGWRALLFLNCLATVVAVPFRAAGQWALASRNGLPAPACGGPVDRFDHAVPPDGVVEIRQRRRAGFDVVEKLGVGVGDRVARGVLLPGQASNPMVGAGNL